MSIRAVRGHAGYFVKSQHGAGGHPQVNVRLYQRKRHGFRDFTSEEGAIAFLVLWSFGCGPSLRPSEPGCSDHGCECCESLSKGLLNRERLLLVDFLASMLKNYKTPTVAGCTLVEHRLPV
jgi:hypothetical protein